MVPLQTSVKNMETKKQIRSEILCLRDQLSGIEHTKKSREILQKLTALPAFARAEQILLFVSYGSEPDTYPLINRCIAEGKKVYCPRVEGDYMDFYEIKGLDELAEGYRGIKEPLPSLERQYHEEAGDFMIMPGAVFDRAGNRIGYGKGFYDRYLSRGFAGQKAAIAFSFQIVEPNRIPVDKTDRRPDYIVTEQEVITWI